jgi:hypothetical protein
LLLLLGGARENKRRGDREETADDFSWPVFFIAWSTDFQDNAGWTT